jgi:threonine dehydratase
MYESINAGRILELESLPTVSDGTAGGIEEGAITFDLCRRFVDDFVVLEEEEILEALRFLRDHEGLMVEGAAALPTAAVLKAPERFADRTVALVISGGRVDEEALERLLDSGEKPDREEAP